MPPILAAATLLMGPQAQALEHGAFLLKWIIIALASAETIPKVLVVLVLRAGFLRMDSSFGVGLGVDAQAAWGGFREACGAAVAGEIALGEDLNEGMLAVALDRACVAYSGGIVRVLGIRRRRVAGKAGEDGLAQWTERLCAVLDALSTLISHALQQAGGRGLAAAYVGKSLARIGFELHLVANEPRSIQLVQHRAEDECILGFAGLSLLRCCLRCI